MALSTSEAYARLNLSVDMLPAGSSNRPGTRIAPTHVTIHNTDNTGRGADALAHARYMKGADARQRRVSWHYTVDDRRCIKSLPTNEKGWHAGSGNSKSIGIEICMHREIDQDAADERAALLTALLLFTLNIPVGNVVPHQFWTGKHCPRRILDGDGMTAFRRKVTEFLEELQEGAVSDPQAMAAPFDLSPLVDLPMPETTLGATTDDGDGTMLPTLSPQDEADLLLGRLYRENVRLRGRAPGGSDTGGPEPDEDHSLPVETGDYGDGDELTDEMIDRMAAELTDEEIASFRVCTEMSIPMGESIEAAAKENPANVGVPSGSPEFAMAASAFPGPAIAVVARKLWRPGRTLRVRFMERADGFSNIPNGVKERIMHYANAWTRDAGINLVFVFGTSPEAEIRISNRLDGTSWSYIGTDALTRPRHEPTMNYGWLTESTSETEYSRVVTHEFGHALGAIHEHQSPRAEIPWDRAKVYAYYRRTNGWDRRTVDINIFQRYSSLTTNSSQYDRQSIMHYAISAELLTDSRYAVGWNTRLSQTDKDFMRWQYPGRPPQSDPAPVEYPDEAH